MKKDNKDEFGYAIFKAFELIKKRFLVIIITVILGVLFSLLYNFTKDVVYSIDTTIYTKLKSDHTYEVTGAITDDLDEMFQDNIIFSTDVSSSIYIYSIPNILYSTKEELIGISAPPPKRILVNKGNKVLENLVYLFNAYQFTSQNIDISKFRFIDENISEQELRTEVYNFMKAMYVKVLPFDSSYSAIKKIQITFKPDDQLELKTAKKLLNRIVRGTIRLNYTHLLEEINSHIDRLEHENKLILIESQNIFNKLKKLETRKSDEFINMVYLQNRELIEEIKNSAVYNYLLTELDKDKIDVTSLRFIYFDEKTTSISDNKLNLSYIVLFGILGGFILSLIFILISNAYYNYKRNN